VYSRLPGGLGQRKDTRQPSKGRRESPRVWAFWLSVTQDKMLFTWKFFQTDLPQVSIWASSDNTGMLNSGYECETQS